MIRFSIYRQTQSDGLSSSTFAWEFTWRTSLREPSGVGRVPTRHAKSACATLFLQATFGRSERSQRISSRQSVRINDSVAFSA